MKTFSPGRRKLLVNGSAAVAATTVASWLPRSHAAASVPTWVPQVVIFDTRYSDSRRFAAHLQDQGARILTPQPDVLHVWRSLQPAFSAGAMRLAGMTQHSDYQILQMLAAEAGGRVLFEAQHDCRGSATMRHLVRAQGDSKHICATLESAGSTWPAALAANVCATSDARCQLDRHSVTTRVTRAADHPGTLFSWLLGSYGLG